MSAPGNRGLSKSAGLLTFGLVITFGACVILGVAIHKASLQATLREHGVQTAAVVTRVVFHPARGDQSAYYEVSIRYDADGTTYTSTFPWSSEVTEGQFFDVIFDSREPDTVQPVEMLAQEDWKVAFGVGCGFLLVAVILLILSRRARSETARTL